LAKGFHRLGVRRGDTVALLMGNRPEWLFIDFAATLLGATLVPLSTWSQPREMGDVLHHCQASTLVTVDRLLDPDSLAPLERLGGVSSSRLPALRRVVIAGSSPSSAVSLDSLWERGAAVADAEIDACQRAVTDADVAYILYTSGTTSTPKGVQLRHGGL